MKKIFKGIAILAATAAVGAGVAFATGCGGSDGVYEGSYYYVSWGHTYGMSVKVTVKNNIITKVEDTTPADWVSVSQGWEDRYIDMLKADGVDVSPSAVYTIVTKSKGALSSTVASSQPTPFTFNVVVGSDGVIKSFEMVTDGSTADSYTEKMPESFKDGSWFVGKKEADILSAFGGSLIYDTNSNYRNDTPTYSEFAQDLMSNELSTGASQSDFICLQAAAFASANAAAVFNGKDISDLEKYADYVIDVANSSVEIVEIAIPKAPDDYLWTNKQAAHWTKYKAWLLQQYEGWTVADVLDIKVYTNNGEPYSVKDDDNIDRNPQIAESGLLLTGATQGSGRLLLAVQNALCKK